MLLCGFLICRWEFRGPGSLSDLSSIRVAADGTAEMGNTEQEKEKA